jgi:Tol biopolymer transport system component
MNTRRCLVILTLVFATGCGDTGAVAVGPPSVASTAIAFATWWDDGSTDGQQVSLLRPDGTIAQLTHGSGLHVPLAWSPDGTRLLIYDSTGYPRLEFGHYAIVTPNGSSETRLTHAPTLRPGYAAWSPDSTLIAIQDSKEGVYSPHDPYAIRLVRADNSGTLPTIHGVRDAPTIHGVRDASFPNDKDIGTDLPLGGTTFSWSPDSRQLAIVAGRGLRTTIDVVNVNGGNRKVLLKPRSGLSGFGNVAWSPDGSRIAFTAFGRTSASPTIFTIQPNGMHITRLGVGVSPVWSPDGSRIAFQNTIRFGFLHTTVIEVVYADGTGTVRIPKSCGDAYTAYSCRDVLRFSTSFTWSPDGSQIAFDFRGPASHPGIWVANADGSRLTQLPTPYGAKLVFKCRHCPNGRPLIGWSRGASGPLWQPAPTAINGLATNG